MEHEVGHAARLLWCSGREVLEQESKARVVQWSMLPAQLGAPGIVEPRSSQANWLWITAAPPEPAGPIQLPPLPCPHLLVDHGSAAALAALARLPVQRANLVHQRELHDSTGYG